MNRNIWTTMYINILVPTFGFYLIARAHSAGPGMIFGSHFGTSGQTSGATTSISSMSVVTAGAFSGPRGSLCPTYSRIASDATLKRNATFCTNLESGLRVVTIFKEVVQRDRPKISKLRKASGKKTGSRRRALQREITPLSSETPFFNKLGSWSNLQPYNKWCHSQAKRNVLNKIGI